MGAIWFQAIELCAFLSEKVGYKSGLALRKGDLQEAVEEHDEYVEMLQKPDDSYIRIRSEELEELLGILLYKVGNIESPRVGYSYIELLHKYEKRGNELEAFFGVKELWSSIMPKLSDEAAALGKRSIDPNIFIRASVDRWGPLGFKIAKELIDGFNHDLFTSPFNDCRRMDWECILELRDLFESESLQAQYGTFFDQRFIDYLNKNFDHISDINWRKFEGLAGEFFTREGFHVEVGPGRDDGGIDLRIWPSKDNQNLPPLILVQCKRQKAKVEKVVVKALWSDVFEEKAQSGLIVTTSAISVGAKAVCKARGYPIEEANKETLRQWIAKMKTPGEGVFMGL